MSMVSVDNDPKPMIQRYAAAWRVCQRIYSGCSDSTEIDMNIRGADFFRAIFGDDNAVFEFRPAELTAWRKYVRENAPPPCPRPKTMA
jgi:hypothetical protein